MQNKDITILVTSCDRFDLLEEMLHSLSDHWDGPTPDGKNVTLWINEDSGKSIPNHITDFLDAWLGGNFGIVYGLKDQVKAVDRLYEKVKTEYVLFLEDDWAFFHPKNAEKGFIEQSMDILEHDPQIMQVWIRAQHDRNRHPTIGGILKTPNGTKYQKMQTGFRGVWSGFSLNPGLRRLSDYQKVGPYSNLTTFNPKEPLQSEIAIGQAYFKAGYRAATLMQGFVKHTGGNGRHVTG